MVGTGATREAWSLTLSLTRVDLVRPIKLIVGKTSKTGANRCPV